jgi:hypothetical protein
MARIIIEMYHAVNYILDWSKSLYHFLMGE